MLCISAPGAVGGRTAAPGRGPGGGDGGRPGGEGGALPRLS